MGDAQRACAMCASPALRPTACLGRSVVEREENAGDVGKCCACSVQNTAAIGRYNRRDYGGDTVVNETICTVGLHAAIQ